MPKSPARAKPRPLLSRPGAHFTCFSDGLCCSDIHALGPLTRSEAKHMRSIARQSVVYDADIEGMCMAPRDGRCYFIKDGLCDVHARYGPDEKPVGCRRFPYGLVSTPDGGRVTTEHRCSCRSMGERPPLDLVDAEVSLKDRAGRLEVEQVVPERMPITARRRVSWQAYRALEDDLLQRLAAGERAETVLAADPLPELQAGSWAVCAAEFFDMVDESAGGIALGYFGDALLHLVTGHEPPSRGRPWASYFERALARTPVPEDPERMINDWIADELWMLRFLEWGDLERGRMELATRLAVVRLLAEWFSGRGLRNDQAAAEALMVVSIATGTSEWPEVVAAIAP